MIGLLFLGALAIGLSDFISSDFTLDFLLSKAFWARILTTNMGVICMVLAILTQKEDTFRQTDPMFLEYNKKINDYHKSDDYSKPVFDLFASEYNLEAKKEQYKINLQYKFDKLKATPEDLEIYANGTEVQKKNNKYCKSMETFKYISSEDYINKNITHLNIDYPSISSSLIFNGFKQQKQGRDYITRNKPAKIVKDLSAKFLMSFAIILFLSAIEPDFKEGITYEMVYRLLTKLFPILMQIDFAIKYGNRYNQEVVLHDAQFRYDVITQFNVWKAGKLKQKKQEYESEVNTDGKRIDNHPIW